MESSSQKDQPFSDLVYSKNVIEFATVANEFCAFTESVTDHSRKSFLITLQKLFALLYLKASLLPDLASIDETEESPEKFVTEATYDSILRKLKARLGEFDSYQEVFDPAIHFEENSVESSISENVADIYQDLKDFLLSYRIGTSDVMRAALWECRNNFEQYWGQRLVNAMRAVHQLVYGNAVLD